MLKGIPAILSPDLLHTLRAMGHGDRLVVADANFPAETVGQGCIRLDGVSATDVLDAVLTVLPLDTFVSDPVISMQVVGDADAVPPIVAEFQQTTPDPFCLFSRQCEFDAIFAGVAGA